LFAISTRTDADSAQVQIIRDLQANRQDPSTEKYLRVGGLIIDATKPVGKPFPDIGKPPDDALARIRLEDLSARQSWEKSRDKNLTAENAKDAKDV
jgi:2,5-furandicarboxylate decarboxylase 1